jgi:hypothetical protein
MTSIRRMTISWTAPAALAAAGLVLTGCAQPGPDPEAGPGSAGLDTQVYQVAATVLEAPGTGPQLCHAVADSYPPQCGGPEVVGWDWDAVESESESGTTWGSYQLTGTWDGERFTLTGSPEPYDSRLDPPDAGPDLTSPCPEPEGGWRPVDPDTATQDGLSAALTRAAADPGYAGSWVDQSYLDDSGDGEREDLEEAGNDPTRLVLNLRFTGDFAAREQPIRQVWGGALCLSGAEHTEAELLDIQRRLPEEIPEGVLGSGLDPVANAVTAQVFVVDPDLQRELDDQYGAGTVILDGWLRPLS